MNVFSIVLVLVCLLDNFISFSQSNPENETQNAIINNAVKKCVIYKDSGNAQQLYYELHYNELGLNSARIFGTDIDEYVYNENGMLINWSFCLDGDSLWCLNYQYCYDDKKRLVKTIYSEMPTGKTPSDSIIYIYQSSMLIEKLYFENGKCNRKSMSYSNSINPEKTTVDSVFSENKLTELVTQKYNSHGLLVYRKFEYFDDRPQHISNFEYDDLNREISATYYSGENDQTGYTIKTFYKPNGLIDKRDCEDFVLYYLYE